MIGIIDYGMGNIKSVANGIIRVGGEVKIVSQPNELQNCSALVLPGVGAFAQAMENLNKSDLVNPIIERVEEDTPILGICLGMQLFAEYSEEFGVTKGLGLVEGRVVKIPEAPGIRLPHMGWNEVKQVNSLDSSLFKDVPDEGCFYFVHSYMVETAQENLTGVATHGSRVTASMQVKNIFATQFHPEKSQSNGATILRNFVNISEAKGENKYG
jgi:glutamine amidotransferase